MSPDLASLVANPDFQARVQQREKESARWKERCQQEELEYQLRQNERLRAEIAELERQKDPCQVAIEEEKKRLRAKIAEANETNRLLVEIAELKRQRALRELQALKAIRAQLTGARLNKN